MNGQLFPSLMVGCAFNVKQNEHAFKAAVAFTMVSVPKTVAFAMVSGRCLQTKGGAGLEG